MKTTDQLLTAARRAHELARERLRQAILDVFTAEARLDDLLDRKSQERSAERPGRMA